MPMINVTNDGQYIVDSNFPDSEAARKGKWLISLNAGTVRILMPERLWRKYQRDIKEADYVVITDTRQGIEVMFEDHTDAPFRLQTTPGAFIGFRWNDEWFGHRMPIHIWAGGLSPKIRMRSHGLQPQ